MVKIKIIDLLNKKSTNEIMPNKIKYSLNELDFQIIVYDEEAGEYVYEKCPNEIWTPSWHHINDEVEIIEEKPTKLLEVWTPVEKQFGKLFDEIARIGKITGIGKVLDLSDELEEEKKIPEKLETYKEVDDEDSYANILKVSKNGEYEIDEATSVIVDKINEIIDYLKSKGE